MILLKSYDGKTCVNYLKCQAITTHDIDVELGITHLRPDHGEDVIVKWGVKTAYTLIDHKTLKALGLTAEEVIASIVRDLVADATIIDIYARAHWLSQEKAKR